MRVRQAAKNANDPLNGCQNAINGNLQFGKVQDKSAVNMLGITLAVSSAGVDTEFTVTHNLGYIPQGWIVLYQDVAGILYASRRGSWTTSQIFLKCNIAIANFEIFVL